MLVVVPHTQYQHRACHCHMTRYQPLSIVVAIVSRIFGSIGEYTVPTRVYRNLSSSLPCHYELLCITYVILPAPSPSSPATSRAYCTHPPPSSQPPKREGLINHRLSSADSLIFPVSQLGCRHFRTRLNWSSCPRPVVETGYLYGYWHYVEPSQLLVRRL